MLYLLHAPADGDALLARVALLPGSIDTAITDLRAGLDQGLVTGRAALVMA